MAQNGLHAAIVVAAQFLEFGLRHQTIAMDTQENSGKFQFDRFQGFLD